MPRLRGPAWVVPRLAAVAWGVPRPPFPPPVGFRSGAPLSALPRSWVVPACPSASLAAAGAVGGERGGVPPRRSAVFSRRSCGPLLVWCVGVRGVWGAVPSPPSPLPRCALRAGWRQGPGRGCPVRERSAASGVAGSGSGGVGRVAGARQVKSLREARCHMSTPIEQNAHFVQSEKM